MHEAQKRLYFFPTLLAPFGKRHPDGDPLEKGEQRGIARELERLALHRLDGT
jgi:hypothetical protein